jgi:hypothetical protein
MIRPQRVALSESDQHRLSLNIAFLNKRLQELDTIEWAITSATGDPVKRLAVQTLLDHPASALREPWLSGWRLIQEFWRNAVREDADMSAFRIRQRMTEGERSGLLVADLVRLVAPRLEVEAFSKSNSYGRVPPRTPRTVQHLFHARLTSSTLRNPAELGLTAVEDTAFLRSVCLGLEAAINEGLDLARRLGWPGALRRWLAGNVRRVYFVEGQEEGDDRDPDSFADGIAPSVKTLHATVQRLVSLDPPMAEGIIARWREDTTSLYGRLWASFAKIGAVGSADDVETFLLDLPTEPFWNLHEFPEIAELRAARFSDLNAPAQLLILARIKRGPPRSQWGRRADHAKVDEARVYWAVRELRRIQTAGGVLPRQTVTWLEERLPRFPDLIGEVALDEGFLPGVQVRSVTHEPGEIYDTLSGDARLQKLERDLATGRQHWDDEDPSGNASAWITEGLNSVRVIDDLEAASRSGSAYPNVWEKFGWAHSPAEMKGADGQALARDLVEEGRRVFALLLRLDEETITKAIEGISYWLSAWDGVLFAERQLLEVWQRLWPMGIEATNARATGETDADLNVVAQGPDDAAPMDLDTLNSPTGRLVGVFLELWSRNKLKRPFAPGTKLQIMRDVIMEAEGRAGLIAKHRMIEQLIFFQNATPSWTKAHLLPLLLNDTADALPLWRAVTRRRLYTANIAVLGDTLLERAVDRRLARAARETIVFSIVVECLHAYRANIEPTIPHARIQQLLRSLDDEVRAHAAEAIHRFVKDVPTAKSAKPGDTAEEVFRSAARPFLREVWPQERSLSTPGISKALADIPAVSGDAFPEAVDAIERFLVPFDCWSLVDFGLYGKDEDGRAKLASINTPLKARALLTLLDRSIGATEGAVVPYDLAEALAQIRHAASSLEGKPEYRRLLAAAR